MSDYFNLNNTTNTRITISANYHDFIVEKDSVIPINKNSKDSVLRKFPYERSNYDENNYIISWTLNKKLNVHLDFKLECQLNISPIIL